MSVDEIILAVAAQITALGAIGTFLLWMYRILVAEPDKRLGEKIQRDNAESLRKSIEPLTDSINMLNHNLEESKEDRKQLNERVKGLDQIANNHETRISVLEKTGGK